jgi:hypothetical protein
VDLRRKTNSIQINWGQRKNQRMSWWSLSKSILAIIKATWLWTEERACSDQLRAMLFKNIPWSSELQQQLKTTLHLRNNFICHLGFTPWKHGYDTRQTSSHNCIWMNVQRMHPPRLIVGPSVLKLEGTLHRMNMGDKLNIIDNSNAFLFTIWLDGLRRNYWEKHWAYNDEPFTASYEIHVWMTW